MSNAADPKAIKRSKARQEALKAQAVEDCRWLLEDVRGRRALQRLRRACGYRAALPVEGAAAIHALGRLVVWQVIDAMIRQVDPEWIGTMEADLDGFEQSLGGKEDKPPEADAGAV